MRILPILVLAGACCAPPALASTNPRHAERGQASWYGKAHQGRRTASGESFDMHALTAAHRTLPFGTIVRVRDLRTGRTVSVRINDRGPIRRDRIIDLSYEAARKLGFAGRGTARVEITVVPQEHAPVLRGAPSQPAPKSPTPQGSTRG